MKKSFPLIVLAALLISVLSISIAFADPVSSASLSEEIVSAEKEDSFEMQDAGEPESDDNKKTFDTDALSLSKEKEKVSEKKNISDASISATGMLHNYVPGITLNPDIRLTINGKELQEGKDYKVFFDNQGITPVDPGEYSVVAKAVEGSAYTGECKIGIYGIYDAKINTGKIYRIVAKQNNNLVLDAAGINPKSGAVVSVFSSNSQKNQAWKFELGNDGYYTIKNFANEELVLDATGEEPLSGASVTAFDNNGQYNQKWVLIPDGDSLFIVNAANESLVLGVPQNKPISGSGAVVINQRENNNWTIEDACDLSFSVSSLGATIRNASGEELDACVSVKMFGETLLEGADYEVLYNGSPDRPVQEGKYIVTIKALGSKWIGEKEVGLFTVYPSLYYQSSCILYNCANDSLVLDATGANPVSGAKVTAFSRNGQKNQEWFLELNSDGTYRIINSANQDLVLDAEGENTVSGASVSSYKSNGQTNQRWILVPKNNNQYVIVCASNENLVLDAASLKPVLGAAVTAFENNGQANQRWTIMSYDSIYQELDGLAEDNIDAVADGSYTMYLNVDTCPVVAVANDSKEESANIQTDVSRAKESQRWEICHDDKGYVLIRNANSGKYLAAEGEKAVSGTNVVQSENSNSRAAKWIFVKNEDKNTYCIYSALYHALVLDVEGGSSEAETNIAIWTANGGAAQNFSLISTPTVVEPCDDVLDSDNYYFIKLADNKSFQLDLTAADRGNGTRYELWSASNVMWQMFRFEYVNGYYKIINAYSDKVLDVDGNSLVPDSPVISFDYYSNADNQLWSVISCEDGSYSFINKKNGLTLEADLSFETNGAPIQTGLAGENYRGQHFSLEKVVNLMPEGLYSYSTALNSSLALDVTGASIKEGANVEIWTKNGGFAQKWWIETVEGKENTYTLQAVCSGMYLSDNGAGNAIQTSSKISENSQWKVEILDGNYVFLNLGTGKALEVNNNNSFAGANVGTSDSSGSKGQQWIQQNTAPISSGIYTIRSLVDQNQVFDIEARSVSDGASLTMWTSNDGGNQKYNFLRNSDGTYTIVNCASGKALDAEAGSLTEGTRIIQFAKNDKDNQKWNVEYAGDGGYKIVSAMDPSLVIAFDGDVPSNGTKMVLLKDKNTKSQHFTFKATTYVPPLPVDQQAMLNRIRGNSSGTQWLIAVDRSTHKVGVFKGSANNWSLQYYWSCTTGAPSSPTITGTYRTTGFKRNALTTDSRAIYCTQIWGGYFFHSILASENELGKSLSHGCIRLPYSAAQWIHSNIYAGTTVVIYN